MIVEPFMTRDVEPVTEDSSLSAAAAVMWNRNCHVVPVVSDAGSVVGLVSDRDLAMAAFTQGRPLHEIQVSVCMNRNAQTCQPETPLSTAWMLMRTFRTEHILVVNTAGELVGRLDLAAMLRDLDGKEPALARTLRQGALSCYERIARGDRKHAAAPPEASRPATTADGDGDLELEELS